MRAIRTKVVGDLEVTTQKLPTLRGSKLRFKVNRLILRDGVPTGELDAEKFTALLAQLPEADADALILESLVCTSIVSTNAQGTKVKYELTTLGVIDQAFDGDDMAMWECVMFSWEVNLSRPTKGVAVQSDPAP
ncbi:MAG: hypothetical protein H0X39_00895 [Actinobacteria bacterium]|nr:hypothetical protein [Actinomycetota bacterium]